MSSHSSDVSVASSQLQTEPPSEKLNKLRKRRRLRRLAVIKSDDKCQQPQKLNGQNLKCFTIAAFLTASIAVLLMAHLLKHDESAANMLNDFLDIYHKHYRQIVSGKLNYCGKKLDTTALFTRIRKREILHQEHALQRLEQALHNQSDFLAIALVGPHGVGKSLVAQSLAQHFPWPENVHTYAWNTCVRDDSEKFAMVQMLAEQLSNCGCNLLIIENLKPKDRYIIRCLNELLIAATTDNGTPVPKKLIVLYIFSLNSFEQPERYQQHHLDLQELPKTLSVNFRTFGTSELRDCIKRDAKLENITLSADDTEQIVASINAERTGCKNVHAKLCLHTGKTDIF